MDLICQTKPKGLTTPMKALDEYILMVVFVGIMHLSICNHNIPPF